MNRDYHLIFCKICTNRKLSLREGLICTITGKQADFEKECPNFHIDELEVEKIKKRSEKEIKDKYASDIVNFF